MQVSLIPAHNSNLKSNRKCNKLKFKDTPIGFQYFSRFKNLHETVAMFNKTEHNICYSLVSSHNMDSICIQRSVHWQQFHWNGNLICMQCLMCNDLVSSKWINFRGRAKSCHWYVACLVKTSTFWPSMREI